MIIEKNEKAITILNDDEKCIYEMGKECNINVQSLDVKEQLINDILALVSKYIMIDKDLKLDRVEILFDKIIEK